MYNVVFIVRGALVPIPKTESDETEHARDYADTLREKYPELEVFDFPCCSKLNTKYLIVGLRLKTIHRSEYPSGESIKCGRQMEKGWKCGEYTVCDVCLGSTEEGHFNVKGIFNEPVEVPNDRSYLWNDGKIDLILESEGLEKVDGAFKTYYMLDDCLSCS